MSSNLRPRSILKTVNDIDNKKTPFTSETPTLTKSNSDIAAQNEINRLEKLYSEQILNNQHSLQELERLELEVLFKEKELLAQQKKYRQVAEINKELNIKLDDESHYYESKSKKFEEMENEIKNRVKYLEIKVSESEKVILEKIEEIDHLNSLLERTYIDSEVRSNQSNEGNTINLIPSDEEDELPNDDTVLYVSNEDSQDENDEIQLISDDDSDNLDFEETRPSTSNLLVDELTGSIDERNLLISKYEFEINSLKKEKHQLYDYINKLLKNKPHPYQNKILKDKLVNRKILRVISATENSQNQERKIKVQKKRVVSNFINLQSYDNNLSKQRPIKAKEYQFSDIGHKLFIHSGISKLNPNLVFQRLISDSEIEVEPSSLLCSIDNRDYLLQVE